MKLELVDTHGALPDAQRRQELSGDKSLDRAAAQAQSFRYFIERQEPRDVSNRHKQTFTTAPSNLRNG